MQVVKKLVCLLLISHMTYSVEFSSALKDEIITPKVRILLGLDATGHHKNVENLNKELMLLKEQWKNLSELNQEKTQEIIQQIQILQQSATSDNACIIQKKIQLLQNLSSILMQIKEVQEKTLELLASHIDFWQKYYSQSMHQMNVLEEKSLYTFLDFQNMTTKCFLQQEQVHQLDLEKKALLFEISKEEHLMSSKEKEFGHVQQLIDDKKKQHDMNKEDIVILDLEKDLIFKEKELMSLKLNLLQKRVEFINSKEFVAQEKVRFLTEQAEIVRHRLYIDVADVQLYQQKNQEQQKIYESVKDDFIKLRHEIAQKKIQAQEELDRLRLRFKIKMQGLKQIEELEYQPHATSENFAVFSLAQAYAAVVTFDRMLFKIKADILLQDAKAVQSKITTDTVKLLYEILQGRIKNSETFEKDRKTYQKLYQTLSNDIKAAQDEIAAAEHNVKDLQRILTHIKLQKDKAKESTPSGSGSTYKKWAETIIFLDQLIKELEQQHEIMLHNVEVYSQITTVQQESLEYVATILHEFNLIGLWHRSMSAVTWEGIKNIVPNILIFLKGIFNIIVTYFSQMSMHKLAQNISHLGLGGFVGLFVVLYLIFFLYLLLQAALPTLYKNLLSVVPGSVDPLYKTRLLLAIVVGFLIEVLKPFYLWSLCLGYEFLFHVPVAFLILFYIGSIVFWIYASRKILKHFILINRKFDYALLSKRLIERFSLVFSFFSISTIVILILRKMLIVVMHEQTELPGIFLRVYHVVIFISIIFSLDKEELLQLFSKNSLGQKFAAIFDRYYYLFLLGVFSLLVLSDPYLGGYGTLMWHIFWNLFLTICVLVGLFVAHTLIKQYTKGIFFVSNQQAVGNFERFEYAKTWYAIYVVCLMLCFAIMAVVLGAYVWGYGFTYSTLKKIALYELAKVETVNALGKVTPESFRLLNLMYIIFMTCLGVFIAYLFKKFVLQRVFDIQYVDPGIQNTVTIISRYIIITIAIMIACIQSNLGFVVSYVSFVGLATFGWSFKDLFTDFVAYFFILVQRPLKLGDYVKIDEEVMGVVRKISPRAVVLRRKNSVNIVVPNSTVLKTSLYNWNYARNYIGFDDIVFCVPFGTDIQLVREICFKVLEEDHDVLKVPQPFVRLQDFADKGYVFMVRGFLSSGNTLRQWDITSNIRFALVEKLAKAGIAIAGPSIKIMVKKDHYDANLEL